MKRRASWQIRGGADYCKTCRLSNTSCATTNRKACPDIANAAKSEEEVVAWDIYATTPQRFVEGHCAGLDHSALWLRIADRANSELLFELITACEAGMMQGLKDK